MSKEIFYSLTYLIRYSKIVLGFVIGFMTGIVLALICDRITIIKKILYPILVSFQSVPKIAVAPLFVIWFGYGLLPKVMMAAMISFFPVLISTMAGLSAYDEEVKMFMDMLNTSWCQRMWKIKLPYAIPYILTGSKVSITFAAVGAILGEFVNPSKGLGYLIDIGKENFDTSLQFAAILLVSIMGWILFEAISLIELFFFKKYSRSVSQEGIDTRYV